MRGIFGAGCFWGAEAAFGYIKGVTQTRVAYLGHDKIESVVVDFDERILSWEKLVEIHVHYWNSVNRNVSPYGSIEPRYQGFVALDEVEENHLITHLASFDMVHPIKIEPHFEVVFNALDWAEKHLQLFYLRKHENLLQYVGQTQQINPSLGTKLNGFLAGNGTLEELESMKMWFDLPTDLWDYLYRVYLRYDALKRS